MSSSADNSVKLWDVSRPRQPENTIKVPRAPVWKVRYTPFGDGLVTLVLNTLVRRENNLMLWNTHNLMSPVHTFYGHTDMVLEFGYIHDCPFFLFFLELVLISINTSSNFFKCCLYKIKNYM